MLLLAVAAIFFFWLVLKATVNLFGFDVAMTALLSGCWLVVAAFFALAASFMFVLDGWRGVWTMVGGAVLLAVIIWAAD